MKLSLPTPASVREEKKRRLRALLDAQQILPTLVDRLSTGFMEIDVETACRWAGWIDALRDDPAWRIIEPALNSPDSWPQVWERARNAGFSAATEHHQAIFFTRLFERALDASHFELARRSWKQALASWLSLGDGLYLKHEVLAPVSKNLSSQELNQVLASLLDGPLTSVAELGVSSLRLHNWSIPPARRALRFVLDILDTASEAVTEAGDEAGDEPLVTGIREGVDAARDRIHRALSSDIDRRLQDLDLSSAALDEFLPLFDGALLRCQHLGFPSALDRLVLRRGLGIIWDLRESGRDEELAITPPMLERLLPCANRLFEADGDDFFGLQGAVADLLVFKGEEAVSLGGRQRSFERALEICPGHRNASRLLSYLLLERANRDLLKTAALPNASTQLGPIRRRIQPLVNRAAANIRRAEELYAENDLLERYQSDLEREIERFKLALEDDHEV